MRYPKSHQLPITWRVFPPPAGSGLDAWRVVAETAWMGAAHLTVDLKAVVANWRALAGRASENVETSAVIKADAYGLGAAQVGPALQDAGVRTRCIRR